MHGMATTKSQLDSTVTTLRSIKREPGTLMKLHAITIVRNEADIWADFISYNSRIFDKLIIIDHRSTDGTAEITEEFKKNGFAIEAFRYEDRGYYQAHLSNTLARRCFEAGADWVFFVDADEFIGVPDRDGLLGLISESKDEVIRFDWINLIPTKFGTFEEFDLSQTFLSNGQSSRYGKVSLSASWAARHPNFELYMGNHSVRPSVNDSPIDTRMSGVLYHLPIRSLDRLRYKLANGIEAYKARTGAGPADGFHWFELYNLIERSQLDQDQISRIILHYGEQGGIANDEVLRLNTLTLPRVGEGRPNIVAKPATLKEVVRRDFAVPWRQIARYPGTDITPVVVGSNIRLQPRPNRGDGTLGRRVFTKLPVSGMLLPELCSDSLFNSLASALEKAFQSARVIVPSAWSGHVPFMFAAVSLLRPRRYVELGTHFGMSFYAACQAAQGISAPAECVAIDTWTGDKHAGFYGDDVFERFTSTLKKEYPEVGYYVRSSFENALPCFEPGSIDILHIDGLHTYEAVKKDYELWLPKMSNCGIMLLHDTNVYDRDFGVWQLWSELERRYATFNFFHSHGLGIAYVGVEPSPIATLLRQVNSDRRLSVLVSSFFRGIGIVGRQT